MKLWNLIKKNKSFRNITIIMLFAWIFLMVFVLFQQSINLSNTREYEVNEAIIHYENIFENYNEKIILLSAYFTEHTMDMSEEDFIVFVEGIVENDNTIDSITVAPHGVIEYVYPESDYDELYGYDIITNAGVTESQELLHSKDNQTILYQYKKDADEKVVEEIYIRNPIYIDDEYYGFVTITIDSDIFSRASFQFISDVIDSAIFTADGTLIYGKGDIEDYDLHQVEAESISISIAEKLNANYTYRFGSNNIGFLLSITLGYLLIFVITYRDKIRLKDLVEELDFRKNFDSETSLYNIDRLYNDVQGLLDKQETFYLAFINIQNVKYINEKFGHKQSITLLKKTTSMIIRVLRNNSTLYRYGGDEYVIITKTDSISEVKNLMRRVVKIFESDIVTGNIRARLGIQAGITKYPAHGYSVEELIKNAHLTSSHVSSYDRESFLFYAEDRINDTAHNEDFDKMVADLDTDLFEVYLMPIVDVGTNLIGGFECLTRVFDDLGKRLNTEDVVLSLERHGKIQKLDEMVFRKMLMLMKKINKEFPEEEYFLSLNASALSVNDEYVNNVIQLYKNARLKKGTIVLELTESYQVDDYDYLITLFKKLNKEGIKVAIDDFGSGYSSLSYISKFPIYAIKVDKEYVRDYRDNDFNKTLLMTLKSIAGVLNCKLVAEGVDSPETLDFLKEFECPFYQGYLFSKGLPYEDAVALVKNNLRKYKKNYEE